MENRSLFYNRVTNIPNHRTRALLLSFFFAYLTFALSIFVRFQSIYTWFQKSGLAVSEYERSPVCCSSLKTAGGSFTVVKSYIANLICIPEFTLLEIIESSRPVFMSPSFKLPRKKCSIVGFHWLK